MKFIPHLNGRRINYIVHNKVFETIGFFKKYKEHYDYFYTHNSAGFIDIISNRYFSYLYWNLYNENN